MHIHILGICGTFMGSLALLARDLGNTVTGSDASVYPPMSTQLENAGIEIMQGYGKEHLGFNDGNGQQYPTPDLVVVGNAMKRTIEAVEYMLDQGIPYTSGPQFLSEQVLQNRHVIAVAGTHGKTTTTTMLAWVLQYNKLDTGFLIGGVPIVNKSLSRSGFTQGRKQDAEGLKNTFAHSSYLGKDFFVIEADEYDSAFFDKRSKFVHYRPRTAILNNLEFDHADIFTDLNAIQTQFHHMIRMIPSSGRIIMPSDTDSLEDTIKKGCWTSIWRCKQVDEFHVKHDEQPSLQWQVQLLKADGSEFAVQYTDADTKVHTGKVHWGMSGLHNVNNGVMAIAAAVDVGVSMAGACEALSNFAGIKRRMELIGDVLGVQVYDDFAHHPTAISTTLDGAKKKLIDNNGGKLWAVIEPRSNTMKMGIHRDNLATSAELADEVLWYEPAGLEWGLTDVIHHATVTNTQSVLNSTDKIIRHICNNAKANDIIIIMSNGGFEGIHTRLVDALKSLI